MYLHGRIGRETYNAYCITPFFPSWLGNGTSRLTLPVMLIGGGVPGLPGTLCGVKPGFADFEAEEEIAATARMGTREDIGLATDVKKD